MRRTELLQEIRSMRFEEAYGGWQSGRLTQGEAARLLGVCERTFRRYIARYEEEGLEGLVDRRLTQVSQRRAPVDEAMAVVERYRSRHAGWSVKHIHACFVPWIGGELDDILCEQHERVVGKDNCVACEGMKRQIPSNRYRLHDVKVKVRVHRYPDGRLAIFHGPRKLACYSADGRLQKPDLQVAASVRRGADSEKRTVYVLPNRTVLFVENRCQAPCTLIVLGKRWQGTKQEAKSGEMFHGAFLVNAHGYW